MSCLSDSLCPKFPKKRPNVFCPKFFCRKFSVRKFSIFMQVERTSPSSMTSPELQKLLLSDYHGIEATRNADDEMAIKIQMKTKVGPFCYF